MAMVLFATLATSHTPCFAASQEPTLSQFTIILRLVPKTTTSSSSMQSCKQQKYRTRRRALKTHSCRLVQFLCVEPELWPR
jgi:hypothetical protein